MNESQKRSSRLIAASTLALTLGLSINQSAHAGESTSTLSVMVQVVNPCEVTVDTDGRWLSWGCGGASFDFSTFSTTGTVASAPVTETTVEQDVTFLDVTY